MEGVLALLLWTAGFVLIVNAQEKLLRVQKTEDSIKYCSTWGMYHFKTFDDRNFNFEGQCTYDFSMDCHSEFPYFHITIQRPTGGVGTIVYFTANIDNVYIVVSPAGIFIDGKDFMEYQKRNSVEVKDTCENLEISGNGITVTWNWADNLKMALDEKFKNGLCGMCGNYDGSSMNDIQWKGFNMSYVLFGNLHKTNDPSGDCSDVVDNTQEQDANQINNKCGDQRDQCETIMSQMGDCKYEMKSYKDYLDTCTEDLCKCAEKNKSACLCSNLNQFSKACVEAKGHPGMWRHPDFCYISCPKTMAFFECASPCLNTCSNPTASQLCTDQCKEGCSCPAGTFMDDVNNNKKCVKQYLCPCAHNGKIYKPGESYSVACQKCTCILGQWTCNQVACSGNCTLKGGSHFQTYDEKEYNFHGNCQYLMSKDEDNKFAIIAKIVQCGMTETVTCLNAVYINLEKMKIKVCYCGNIYINNFLITLPKINDKIAIYKRSAFYIYIVTTFGLSVKVQVKPVFQLFISVNSTMQNKTLGLCGNFNGIEGDDLMTISGVVEDAVSAFCNSYKIQASCNDVPDNYDNPCSKSITKEEYANHWCSRLANTDDVFAPCHGELDPKPYQKHCIYDVCNSENSEEAMCAWLGEYANECRSRNVILEDWRDNICDPGCPETMVFTSNPRQCNFTCNSLAEPDILCYFRADPREGCSCPEGAYMTQNEKCVPPEDCPCTYKGRTVPARQTFKIDEILCKCIRGILECPKTEEVSNVCKPPMYYYDCSSPNPDTVGSQCQKSCKTQDMECYSNECVPGCVCPKGLVSDDNDGCILPNKCPCVFGGKFHDTGTQINISCNTCTCKNRTWECTKKHCPKTCSVYGNGHLITFDQSRNDLSGDCDYILAQDFCPNNGKNGTFKIIIQNIICGDSNTICSLRIRIILLNASLDIYKGRVEEARKLSESKQNFYSIGLIGQYIVVQMVDVTVMYDQKMSVIVQLSNSTEGTVCGLCGDNDGRAVNDLTSPWSQGCIHEGSRSVSPCTNTPEKLAWAQKHCSLIKSDVFASCHLSVDPIPFYETCVADTCSCKNDIGNCECLCTSIAAYSAECRRHDICIKWRTPNICPLFCDYFNKDGHCDWHYNPCGTPCMATCLNPQGDCQERTEMLEGCYPECSKERPYFDVENQICVHILNCSVCSDRLCDNQTGECLCCYNGITYRNGESLTEVINGQKCVIGYCIDGYIAMAVSFCGYFTPKTTALTIMPRTFTQIPTTTTLSYTNASTTTQKKYSTKLVPASGLSQTSSRSTTKRYSTFLSRTIIESKSTSRISPPYSQESTTLKTKVTSTTPPRVVSDIFPTLRTTKLSIPTSTLPVLISKTTTMYPPYSKPSTTLTTKVTSTTPPRVVSDIFPTISTTKLSIPTSTKETTQSLSKTTSRMTPVKYSTTLPVLISKTTTMYPPYSKPSTTLTTKVTSTTPPHVVSDIFPTLSTTKLSIPTSTKETTQSLSKTTSRMTPVKYSTTLPVLISKTTTMYPPYSKSSTNLKTKMTMISTTPRIYSDTFSTTSKLPTSSQSSKQTILPKTTPFQFTMSMSTTTKPPTTTGNVTTMFGKSSRMTTTGSKTTQLQTEETYTRTYSKHVTTEDTAALYSLTTCGPPIDYKCPDGPQLTLQGRSRWCVYPADCLLMSQFTNITKGECRTVLAVSVNYCTGRCTTSSTYSHRFDRMTRMCSCCMETDESTRTVLLTCLDGSTELYTYVQVENCSCVAITCHQEN